MPRSSKNKLPSATRSPTRGKPNTGQTVNVSDLCGTTASGWEPAIICLLLGLAVWVVFGQTRYHEFVNYDDARFVYENSATRQGLSLTGIVRAFTRANADEWYPLTAISHMLDWQLYGPKAGGHHLTNVLLHAATAILLFLVLRKMTGAMLRSVFVAAVFALHPLRVESVAWVTERKDVLSGLFFMLTLWAYVKHVSSVRCQASGLGRVPESRVTGRLSRYYWLALLLFALGLLSKTMLVTLPFVLLLLDYWPLQRVSGVRCPGSGGDAHAAGLPPGTSPPATYLRLLWEKIPFLLLSAAAGVATVLAQKGAIQSVQDLGILARVGNALVTYVVYLGQLVYPVGLAVFYPHPGNRLSVWTVAGCAVVLSLITVGAVRWQRQRPYLLVARWRVLFVSCPKA